MRFHGYNDSAVEFARVYGRHFLNPSRFSRSRRIPPLIEGIPLGEPGEEVHQDPGEVRIVDPLVADSTRRVDVRHDVIPVAADELKIPPLSFISVPKGALAVSEMFQVPQLADGRPIMFAEGQPRLSGSVARSHIRLDGVVIPTAWGHTAWNPCHWTLEACALLSVLDVMESPSDCTVLLPPRPGPFEQASMEALSHRHKGLRIVRPQSGDLLQCDQLILPVWDLPPHSSLLPSRVTTFIDQLGKQIGENSSSLTECDLVFVSRAKASRRRLREEAQLIDLLGERFSVLSVVLEDHSHSEQIRMVQSGRVVAGVHGAGLVHLAWAGDSGLVEILPTPYETTRHYQYATLTIARDLRYRCVLGGEPNLREDFSLSEWSQGRVVAAVSDILARS